MILRTESVWYRLMEWMMRLAYLNFLWFIFTLLGGIVFGWVPATLAVNKSLRKFMIENESISIFPYFWNVYRKQFIRSQIVNVLFIALGLLLFIDMKFFMSGNHALFILGKMVTIQLVIGYFVLFIYFFTIYAHQEMRFIEKVKNSILYGIVHPIKSLLMLINSSLLIMLFLFFPQLFIFFGVSSLAYFNILCSQKVLYKKNNSISHSS
ncbi:putative membrane protein YesL [Neobacillus niacini]|uniref:YesL family protein n=1 Tax=Neobacillus niacini TaxID=86668 RepID=UPI002863D7A6|nr:DUF624 domain-containing protein [Neobacillus niacini]MDR7078691.1 putative membrane protein YesL [Neobacillus niacini]